MALTTTEVEAAIRRALLNGETWEMGDIKSHISLERLLEIQNQVSAGDNGGIEMRLATMAPVVGEAS